MKSKLNYLKQELITMKENTNEQRILTRSEINKSRGHIDAIDFCIKQIDSIEKPSKNSLNNLLDKINAKVRSSIYSLMKTEESYAIKESQRYQDKISYLDGLIHTLQEIRGSME